MKRFFKRLICRIFGHKRYSEWYAVRISFFKHQKKGKNGHRYDIVCQQYCDRCGERSKYVFRHNISRAQMLKEGWFVEG